jgi:hypothetical protein
MLGSYYYHEIIRKTIISFGTLFNDLNIKHKDSSGGVVSQLKVPLAYGPTQKFLARLEQQANLDKPVQITMPRMSFEMTSIAYDSTRKSGITQTFYRSLYRRWFFCFNNTTFHVKCLINRIKIRHKYQISDCFVGLYDLESVNVSQVSVKPKSSPGLAVIGSGTAVYLTSLFAV